MGAHETNRLGLAQEAVDATASAYAEDGGLDVERRLMAELAQRGIEPLVAEPVLQSLSHGIRSGHPVTVQPGQLSTQDENAPGSMGGDNGGG